jgi:hypothetical protein
MRGERERSGRRRHNNNDDDKEEEKGMKKREEERAWRRTGHVRSGICMYEIASRMNFTLLL